MASKKGNEPGAMMKFARMILRDGPRLLVAAGVLVSIGEKFLGGLRQVADDCKRELDTRLTPDVRKLFNLGGLGAIAAPVDDDEDTDTGAAEEVATDAAASDAPTGDPIEPSADVDAPEAA